MIPQLRPARSTDAGTLGAMLTEAAAGRPWKPRLHSAAEDIAHVGGMIDRGWVTVAESDAPLGFLAREDGYIHALFIASAARGQGVGEALLAAAKAGRDALDLWTFQANTGARRFYRRAGFWEVERTDGQGNDERLPDVRLRWERAAPQGEGCDEQA